MENYEGFRIIGIKPSEASEHIAYIYWKVHVVREYSFGKPPALTLFIINLPPYTTEERLKGMMSKYGKVKRVFLHKKPDAKTPPTVEYPLLDPPVAAMGFRVGYVVFTSHKSLKKVMLLPSNTVLIASTVKHPIKSGLCKWYEEYNNSFCSEYLLKNEVKNVIENYDKQKKEEDNSNEADDDGWVTVSSKKRKRKAEKSGSKPSKYRKKKKLQPVNFYAFQKKAAKMEYLSQQQKKYEEDRKRLSIMKSARKFKPL